MGKLVVLVALMMALAGCSIGLAAQTVQANGAAVSSPHSGHGAMIKRKAVTGKFGMHGSPTKIRRRRTRRGSEACVSHDEEQRERA